MILVFGAFVNAAGMVGPMLSWQDDVAMRFGLETRLIPATLLVFGLLVLAPTFLVGIGASLAGWLGERDGLAMAGAWRRFVYGLIPIGFAMWLVHFGFHFATSAGTAVSVIQRIGEDLGLAWDAVETYAGRAQSCSSWRSGSARR